MTFGTPFQRVHDVKALGFHQLFGLGVPFGIETDNRRLVVEYLARQLKLPRQADSSKVELLAFSTFHEQIFQTFFSRQYS